MFLVSWETERLRSPSQCQTADRVKRQNDLTGTITDCFDWAGHAQADDRYYTSHKRRLGGTQTEADRVPLNVFQHEVFSPRQSPAAGRSRNPEEVRISARRVAAERAHSARIHPTLPRVPFHSSEHQAAVAAGGTGYSPRQHHHRPFQNGSLGSGFPSLASPRKAAERPAYFVVKERPQVPEHQLRHDVKKKIIEMSQRFGV